MQELMIEDFNCLKKVNGARKLFILLHGYGANKEDLYPLSSYLGEQFDYLFPNAPIRLAQGFFDSRCWFNLDMNRFSMSPEQIKAYLGQYRWEDLRPMTERLVQLTSSAAASYDEVVLGGFSQGSMMALLSALTLNRPLKSLVLFSSHIFMHVKLTELLNAYKLPLFPVFQTHGQMDQVLPYSGGEELKKLLVGSGFQVDFQSFNGGHGIDPAHFIKIKAALA
jgi:phospholipase/carboxylesterase